MSKDPYRYFRIEARELLDGLSQGLLRLEQAFDAGLVVAMLRYAHTLKGAARVVKQQRLAELAHALEDILVPCRESQALDRGQTSQMFQMLDECSALLQHLDPAPAAGSPSAVEPQTSDSAASPTPTAPGSTVAGSNPRSQPPGHAPDLKAPLTATAAAAATQRTDARREAGALDALQLDTLRVDVADLERLTRDISEAAVKLAGLHAAVSKLHHATSLAATLAQQLDREPSDTTQRRQHNGGLRALVEQLRTALEESRHGLALNVEQVEQELDQVREHAQQLRLLPASTIFMPLERVVRDAAEAENKTVDFRTNGGDIKVDAYVLSVLNEALVHVVRNAVSHGIETPAERVRAGKSARGSVQILVQRRGRRICIACQDDGRGVDAAAVRRAAIARGAVTRAEAAELDLDATLRLILRAGITTRSVVTAVSGRGVGLDVLSATIARLKGDVLVQSEPGQGTTIEVLVPLSVSSTPALLLDAGGMSVSLPLDSVQQALRLADDEIARTPEGDAIRCEGRVLPFIPLAQALGRKSKRRPAAWSAVVVQSGARAVALGAERLVATGQVVIRPLPKLLDAMPLVTGVSIDAEGYPRLVLDPAGLVALGVNVSTRVEASAPTQQDPILIIDDSLTTRMLEHSILETAGYQVQMAASAEEGLSKAQAQHFALFVVDVEMPGMDGFQFVEQTKRDPKLRDIPAVLVTSRCEPEDFGRADAVGASGYIVKGEFDQDKLLQTIRRLLDEATAKGRTAPGGSSEDDT